MRYTILRRGNQVKVIDTKRLRLQHLRRRVHAWSRVVDDLRASGQKFDLTMYRLSYDTEGTLVEANNWQPLDISEFIDALHARMGKRLLAYAWVAELQQRGVIHYHVIIAHTGRAPMPDRQYRSKDARGHIRTFDRLWTHGSSHTDFKVRSAFYLASYVKKEYQKAYEFFPSGCHAWAVWISDIASKKMLQLRSLEEFKQRLFYEEYCGNGDGAGFSWTEAWEHMEWEVQREKLTRKIRGETWEYVGAVNDAKQLAKWGVSDELLSKHIFTTLQIPTA